MPRVLERAASAVAAGRWCRSRSGLGSGRAGLIPSAQPMRHRMTRRVPMPMPPVRPIGIPRGPPSARRSSTLSLRGSSSQRMALVSTAPTTSITPIGFPIPCLVPDVGSRRRFRSREKPGDRTRERDGDLLDSVRESGRCRGRNAPHMRETARAASVSRMRDPRPQSIARDYGDLGESARNHPPLFADALARRGAGI